MEIPIGRKGIRSGKGVRHPSAPAASGSSIQAPQVVKPASQAVLTKKREVPDKVIRKAGRKTASNPTASQSVPSKRPRGRPPKGQSNKRIQDVPEEDESVQSDRDGGIEDEEEIAGLLETQALPGDGEGSEADAQGEEEEDGIGEETAEREAEDFVRREIVRRKVLGGES